MRSFGLGRAKRGENPPIRRWFSHKDNLDFRKNVLPEFVEPNDVELALKFPPGISSAEEKVLYALWHEGDQCFCNLRILTGLSDAELRRTLSRLVNQSRVVERKPTRQTDRYSGQEWCCFGLAA